MTYEFVREVMAAINGVTIGHPELTVEERMEAIRATYYTKYEVKVEGDLIIAWSSQGIVCSHKDWTTKWGDL
jgi:hypothetical protein